MAITIYIMISALTKIKRSHRALTAVNLLASLRRV